MVFRFSWTWNQLQAVTLFVQHILNLCRVKSVNWVLWDVQPLLHLYQEEESQMHEEDKSIEKKARVPVATQAFSDKTIGSNSKIIFMNLVQ